VSAEVTTSDVYALARGEAEACRIFDDQPCANPKCAMARELVAAHPVVEAAEAYVDADRWGDKNRGRNMGEAYKRVHVTVRAYREAKRG
jgi:hypothetical protein